MTEEEEEAIAQLKVMSKEELDLVPYEIVWWICDAKGCCGGTKVRDYGIAPEYWHRQGGFFSINERGILCSKHWPLFKRLKKNYSIHHIVRKMIDLNKKKIMTIQEKKDETPKRKNKLIPEMKRRK